MLVLLVVLRAGLATAQAPDPTTPPEPATAGSERVLEQLGIPQGVGGATSLPHPQAIPKEPLSPLGDELLTGLLHGFERIARSIREDVAVGRATLRRLRGLGAIERADLYPALRTLAAPVLVSLAVAVIGRIGLRPVVRRLGRAAAGHGPLRVAALAVVKIVLDFAVVLIAALAASAALRSGDIGDPENGVVTYYLGAFVVAGALIVALRAIFSPAAPELRPLPVSDASARYWTWRLGAVVALISLGEIFLPPFLTQIATPIAARAATVAAYAIALLYLIYLVIVNRRAPGNITSGSPPKTRGSGRSFSRWSPATGIGPRWPASSSCSIRS